MKKEMKFVCAAVAAVFCLAACEKPQDNGYEGTNYIELSSSVNSMYDAEGTEPVTVTVTLTASLDEDLVLDFTVNGNDGGILELKDNPVTIKAGGKTGSFSIGVVGQLPEFTESADFVVTLDEGTQLPDKVVLKEDLNFTVKSSLVPDLTEAQKEIVETYKSSTGIDLSAYLGVVQVNVEFAECDFETGEYPAPETFKTSTIIQLSETSASGKPVLKMVSNPMGINDKIYGIFRKITVLSEYWVGEYAGPDYATLMNGINWNKDSQETFEMTLDGIALNADKSVEFTAERLDSYGDPIVVVPFDYIFSAYEREKNTELDITEGSDATANPEMHLNVSDITEDYYEYEGDGLWTAPVASISEDEMKFTFCFDYLGAYDYIRITATYSPNK